MTAPPAKAKCRNMAELFWNRVEDMPNLEAFRYPVGDMWKSLTWKQTGERVRAIACGLRALGIENEDRCAILATTRLEWVLADTGIMCAGAATTTVYPSTPASGCSYILNDSDTRVIFAEDDGQIAKLREQKAELPELFKVVTFDGRPDKERDGDWVMTLAELEEMGKSYESEHPEAVAEIAKELGPEHLATLIYTSGTTGLPKGVRLVHDCWVYAAEAMAALELIKIDDLQYLWLPLSHSFGKVMLAGQMAVGFPSAVDGRIPKLIENLAVVKPTFVGAAPRIFEKAYNKIIGAAKEGSALKYKLFTWAIGVGHKVSALKQERRSPSGLLALQHKLAQRLVGSKIQARFGGRIKFFISGSAPLSREISQFFDAAGLLILEGYGLTESSAASFVNRLDKYRFGTVGLALPGTEVRIAEADGEILLKSRGVMRGYHKLPDKTAEILDDDGWLHTGDIGQIDSDGFLKITDRKKDLIKTSGGKYVAPQHLEGCFKALCPLVSQIVVHGDRRNYCTALITLDPEAITAWALNNDLARASYEELTRSDKVRAVVQDYIDQLNSTLASYETIKRFSILPRDLTEEDDELTPSLKVKRKAVEKNFMDVLNSMYEGTVEAM